MIKFLDKKIENSAGYSQSPEALKKKSPPTAAVIATFTMHEIKKTKKFIKLEDISRTMTLDQKKILQFNKMAEF